MDCRLRAHPWAPAVINNDIPGKQSHSNRHPGKVDLLVRACFRHSHAGPKIRSCAHVPTPEWLFGFSEFLTVVDSELCKYPVEVALYRSLGNRQIPGDLLVAKTAPDQFDDLGFP